MLALAVKNLLEKTSNVNYAGLVGFNFDAVCARYKVGITYSFCPSCNMVGSSFSFLNLSFAFNISYISLS